MSHGDVIQLSLKTWLDENLPKFLTSINNELVGEVEWQMPSVEDYCLVVSVRDFKDGGVGIFSITDRNVPSYRIAGLLQHALNG